MEYLFLYLILINALGFLIMLVDKRKAITRRRRISERVLLNVAILGGSIGTYLAMEIFSHKTKHKEFAVGVPILVVVHLLIVLIVANI